MKRADKIELIALLEEKERRVAGGLKLSSYFPDTGPYRRELYPKHTQFFAAGKKYRERLLLAANRIGKTDSVGCYETTLHLTGKYPTWWEGRRFDRPIDAWAAGDTSKTVRDILQFKFLGPSHDIGSGLIPRDCLLKTSSNRGLANAVDTIFVKHISGGISQLGFKSYDQKRESFQGTEKDLIYLDEEMSLEIYTECLLRTMTNNGLIMLTFTPLMGMSETVMAFLPGGQIGEHAEGSKYVVMGTWDDAAHLTQEVKDELWKSIPPFQRDARSKGIPQLGAGAIFPVPETDVVVPDMEIPKHWPRCYALDVGWNRTAALWGAINRETDILYLTAEYYRGEADPATHAQGVKAISKWRMPGVIDPAARGRAQKDGSQLMQDYIDLGLDLDVAFNGVESGLLEVYNRMSTGRLKVFKSLQNFLFEFRLYRRDQKGHIVKANDHLMDALRYLVMSGLDRAKVKPPTEKEMVIEYRDTSGRGTGWMG